MTISLRLNDSDSSLIKKYASLKGISVSDLIRSTIMEKIEDEIDLTTYNTAMAEYRENPVSYSHTEVMSMLSDID